MSIRAATVWLWLAMCVTVPAPFFAVETGRIPVVGLAVLATAITRAAVADPETAATFLAWIVSAEALVYALAFLGLARVAARALARRFHRTLAVVVSGLVVGALVVTTVCDVYVTPFGRRSARTNLPGIFD